MVVVVVVGGKVNMEHVVVLMVMGVVVMMDGVVAMVMWSCVQWGWRWCTMGVDCVVLMDVIGLIGEVMFVIQGVYGVGVFNSIDYVMTS